jgi:hypothetical protein
VPRSRIRVAILPLPQYFFMAWCFIKHKDNFYLYFHRLYGVELEDDRDRWIGKNVEGGDCDLFQGFIPDKSHSNPCVS